MKICILGAGALGCALGAALTQGGSDVWLLNRSQAHVDAMNHHGLALVTPDGERRVAVRAATRAAEVGPVDLVIVLVKSFDTRAAMSAATALLGPQTVLLSLQNGLGHEDILGEIAGRERVVAGKTYVGGVLLGPGRILSGSQGKATLIGELDGQVTPRIQAIAAEFERAGLDITVSANILGAMWDKLLVNVATGALSGLTRLTYGELYRVPEIEASAVAAVAEAMAVARACGVTLSTQAPRDAWVQAAAGLPADFKTSLLQSLEKGARGDSPLTEIDFINGAVVRWGQRCGVPTPVNQTLVAGIKGVEHALALQLPEPECA